MSVRFIVYFNDTAPTEIYTYGHTLALHDALPVFATGAYGTETGLFAYSIDDAASADNTGTITSRATGDYGQAWGIYAAGYGDVSASNSATGTIIATAGGYYGRATGISASSLAGAATIDRKSVG